MRIKILKDYVGIETDNIAYPKGVEITPPAGVDVDALVKIGVAEVVEQKEAPAPKPAPRKKVVKK